MDMGLNEKFEQLLKKIDVQNDRWLNTKEACAYTNLSRKTLYNAVQRGSLKSARGIKNKVLYKIKWLDNYVMNG
jgi:excisionase family DNA binding protein